MSFIVNKEKLKDNFLKHIRNERAKEFEKLDIEYQRADEVNDASAKATIIQKKNKLRDSLIYRFSDDKKRSLHQTTK